MTKWDGSNIHSLLSYSAVRAIFDAYKATFNEIFEWFHNNSDLKTAFQLFESYKQMHEAVFRLSDLQFNQYRFIDTQVLEDMDQPLFLVPFSYNDSFLAIKDAKECYRKWFPLRNNAGFISNTYSRNDEKYFLKWHETEKDFKGIIGGTMKPLVTPTFVFNQKDHDKAEYNKKPSQAAIRLLELLHNTAIEFNLCNISRDTDLELEARLGPVAKRVIEDDILLCVQGLSHLPYNATHSLTHLLEYLAQFPYKYASRWKARQLKMGFFLKNPYARMAWFRLFSSILYSYECICKFRKPSLQEHNIYHMDYPSFARGPSEANADLSNFVPIRDNPCAKVSNAKELLVFQRQYTQAEAWYKVLTYCNQELPHIGFIQEVFPKFAMNNKLGNMQFTIFPMILEQVAAKLAVD